MIEWVKRDSGLYEHKRRLWGCIVDPRKSIPLSVDLPLFAYLLNCLAGTLNSTFKRVHPPTHDRSYSIDCFPAALSTTSIPARYF